MDDDRRAPHADEDIDPDVISIWDMPLARPTVERTGRPATEIAAAPPAHDDDEITDVSYSRALAASEEWFDSDDDDDGDEPRNDSHTRQLHQLEPDAIDSAAAAASAPPPPAAPQAAGAPSGGGLIDDEIV